MLIYLVVFSLKLIIFVGVNASSCDVIKQKYAPANRFISWHGEPINISVYWDSDPGRAAAAQLTVILRHVLGYKYVHLRQAPQDGPMTGTESCNDNEHELFPEVKLRLSISTKADDKKENDEYNNYNTYPDYYDNQESIDDKRFYNIEKLHVYIPKQFRIKKQCTGTDVSQDSFYGNVSSLRNCGFSIICTRGYPTMDFYSLTPCNSREKLSLRSQLPLLRQYECKTLNRTKLFKMLTENQSFLFFDYDMWDEDEDVTLAAEEQNRAITEAFIIACQKYKYARDLFQMIESFKPSFKSLRHVLKIESSGKTIEEANCEYILNDNYNTIKHFEKVIPATRQYEIITIGCKEDDNKLDLITVLGQFVTKHYFPLILKPYSDDCTDPEYMVKMLNDISTIANSSLIGVVLPGVNNLKSNGVAEVLNNSLLPVFLYDSVELDVDSTTSVWITNGRLPHLILAIQQFLVSENITNIVVLYDLTARAGPFNDHLRAVPDLNIRFLCVSKNSKIQEAKKILVQFKSDTTKVIILNTNHDQTAILLSAAAKLGMTKKKGFTFITWDGRQENMKWNFKHLSFSFWSMNHNDIPGIENWFDKDHRWPPQDMAFVNAVLTLVQGFKDVISEYPQARDDTQSKYVTEQLKKSLIEISPIRGVYQNLIYKGHSLEEALVFLNECGNGRSEPLALYRINVSVPSVKLQWKRTKSKTKKDLRSSTALNVTAALHNCSIVITISLLFLLHIQTAECNICEMTAF